MHFDVRKKKHLIPNSCDFLRRAEIRACERGDPGREHVTQIMLETFIVPAMNEAIQVLLERATSSLTTPLVSVAREVVFMPVSLAKALMRTIS